MFQRRYGEALDLVKRARSMFASGGDSEGEARALIQRGSIQGCAGRREESVTALQEAAALLEEDGDRYLIFAAYGNRANALARSGNYQAAIENLERARSQYVHLNHPLGLHELQGIDGFIMQGLGDAQEAERLYLDAQRGFLQAGELCQMALTNLDLMVLYSEQRAWPSVLKLAAETLSPLNSLRLYPETLSAVSLLAEAVPMEEVSRRLLREVRDSVRQDPLTQLA